MNRFLLFAVMLSAIAVCFAMHDWANNPGVIKITTKVCSKDSKPTEEQWTAYLACNKPCNETKPDDAKHGDRHEKMKAALEECAKKADDVNDLKTNNAEKDKYIIMLCSEKNKVCLKEMYDQCKKDGGEKKDEYTDEDRKKWQNIIDEKVNCSLNALGLTI